MHLTERDLFHGYRIPPPLAPGRIARAHAVEASLMERVSELLRWRRWYRAQPRRLYWLDLALRNDAELRALVAVARTARRAVDAIPDELTTAKAHADWTSGELVAGFGK